MITLLGFLTASIVGRTIVAYGETLLDRVPLVRNLYRGLRQLFQTALSQTSRSFQKVVLVEYPTKGVWRVGFVATRGKGEISRARTRRRTCSRSSSRTRRTSPPAFSSSCRARRRWRST